MRGEEIDHHIENINLGRLCAAHPDVTLGHHIAKLNHLAIANMFSHLSLKFNFIVTLLGLSQLLEVEELLLVRFKLFW